MFSIFYNFSLALLALLTSPKILYLYFFRGKGVESFPQKLGLNLPNIKKEGHFLIWIHAVSVGETRAVCSLIKLLKKQYHNAIIVVSSTTETGHAEAIRSLPYADYHIYLPLDFSWIIGPCVKRIAPDLAILCESDFWYNFLKSSRDIGAKVALVNGKISTTSANKFSRFPFFSKKLFSLLDIACLQSEHYRPRFIQSGVSSEKLLVTGNLKLDSEYPKINEEELQTWRKQLGIEKDDKVIVLGSTHEPEEEQLLNACSQLWNKYPSLKLVIVPRHPERFDTVAHLLDEKELPYLRFSNLKQKKGGESVLLVDAMGLLLKCYQFADIAIVAGSYTDKVGGHNIVEPCWYGVPTIFGPHMESQPELVELVAKYQAGHQVSLNDLPAVLQDLLDNENKRKALGRGGLDLAKNCKGATELTWKCLDKLVAAKLTDPKQ